MKINTYANSDALLLRAGKVVPSGVYGHLGPGEGCFIPVSAFPKFSDHAKGAYFWDVDGNRFIDYMCAYGPNVLGYGDPEVDAAALEQLARGDVVTSPGVNMIELAELLVDTVACADWAFFAKNGGDMTTLAVMIARAATGKKKVVLTRGFYHGVAPWCQRVDNQGVLPEEVANSVVIDFNDAAAFRALAAEGDVAAFMSTPYFHGNFMENELPRPGYWQEIRAVCDQYGVVLIIDDVRTGYRLDLAGSDHYYGFKADLLCQCKAIANGWSLSALLGRDSLKPTAGAVTYTGSYWLGSAAFAAAIACIRKMRRVDAAARHRALGLAVGEGLIKVARENGAKLIVSGEAPLFYLRLAMDDSLLLHQEWIAEIVKRGVFMTNHHNHFTNLSLSAEDIGFTLEAADDALKAVKAAHPEVDWSRGGESHWHR